MPEVHVYQRKDLNDILEDYYRRISPLSGVEHEQRNTLGIFVVPTITYTRNNQKIKWRFADKLPKGGVHLDPTKRTPRMTNLLRATRGFLLFTNQYDPSWFNSHANFAYWLGYWKDSFFTYYGKDTIIQKYLLENRVPATYDEGFDDHFNS